MFPENGKYLRRKLRWRTRLINQWRVWYSNGHLLHLLETGK